MPLQALAPNRLYRQIADQLRGLILGGEYAVGARLPTERELAAQLKVSRPTVREALIALEIEGLVEVRAGSGIHVGATERAASAPRVDRNAFGPFEIIRARQLVEGELAALAARRGGKLLVAGLRAALVLMTQDIERGVTPIRGDRLFHLRIAEAAGNAPLLRTVTELFDERHGPLFEQLGAHFENERSWGKAVAEHEAVVDAIAARKPEQARRAMHRHLQRSHDRYAEAWPRADGAPRAVRTPRGAGAGHTGRTGRAAPAARSRTPRPAGVAA